VVVTNDFWMPAVLPWVNARSGQVIASIARFPKKQFFLYKRCAAIAPVSSSVADAIREQTPDVADKITVVPNCVDAAFLRETKRQRDKETKRLEEESRQRGPVRILYVGRIHPEKGLGLLANALRLLAARKDAKTKSLKDQESNWECVLVGPVKQSEGGGGEFFAEELKQQVKGLPVRFEAPVYDPAALAKIYDDADVFVYPSVAETGESFGIAPLEAMARGVVPVVSDLAVFREYLESGVNGMVFDHRTPQAAANLAASLRDLVEDPARRERMGAAARQTAERFSPAAIADKYLQLFEKVISGT
jgi:glycosyltransferase involved in cell wall biosynthesis